MSDVRVNREGAMSGLRVPSSLERLRRDFVTSEIQLLTYTLREREPTLLRPTTECDLDSGRSVTHLVWVPEDRRYVTQESK